MCGLVGFVGGNFTSSEVATDILEKMSASGITIRSNLERIRSDFDNLLSEDEKSQLKLLSLNSSAVCDGKGVHRVLDRLEQSND